MIAYIKLTDRMLGKHQINAKDTFKQFALEELGIDYGLMQKGEEGKITKPIVMWIPHASDQTKAHCPIETELRMYRQKTRGDCLLSIKDLKKLAQAGDTLKIGIESVHAHSYTTERYISVELFRADLSFEVAA